jgi:poly(hydroxyalkanoate) depolymerase family esterase
VVVLPGAGETSDDAARHSRFNEVAQRLRFVVAYPEQNPEYNASQEWDWATASKEGRANREASLIAGLTRAVVARNHLDPRKVFVMGISAGGGMATAMAVAFPDVYRGLGLEAACPFDNVGCAGSSVTADQSAAAVVKAMGGFRRAMPVFNEYGSADPIAVGVSSHQVVPSWLTVDDLLDDGEDNGSVSRDAASTTPVTPAPPMKPYLAREYRDSRGCALALDWLVLGETHAWSGGGQSDPSEVTSDPLAPDATTAMYLFFTRADTLGGSSRCAAR